MAGRLAHSLRRMLALGAILSVLPAADGLAQPCEVSATLPAQTVGRSGCQALASTGITPISDLGCGTYKGLQGGLFPLGADVAPEQHALDGRNAASAIVPRLADGTRDGANGKIGFASIGMSNTEMEFSWLRTLMRTTPGLNSRVEVVNGAQGTRTAEQWADPDSVVWTVLNDRLAAAGLTNHQVQAVWIKLANGDPARFGAFPQHAFVLEGHLALVLRIAKARYPNLAVAYLSSRTRAYTAVDRSLNPEPYAYESGFAAKWLIEEQIAGNPILRFQGAGAPVPWITWGPYLWADGVTPRDDGFTWACSDVSSDFVHPSFAGQEKVAGELLFFLQHEPTARRWFLQPRQGCGLLGIEPVGALAAAALARRRARRASRP